MALDKGFFADLDKLLDSRPEFLRVFECIKQHSGAEKLAAAAYLLLNRGYLGEQSHWHLEDKIIEIAKNSKSVENRVFAIKYALLLGINDSKTIVKLAEILLDLSTGNEREIKETMAALKLFETENLFSPEAYQELQDNLCTGYVRIVGESTPRDRLRYNINNHLDNEQITNLSTAISEVQKRFACDNLKELWRSLEILRDTIYKQLPDDMAANTLGRAIYAIQQEMDKNNMLKDFKIENADGEFKFKADDFAKFLATDLNKKEQEELRAAVDSVHEKLDEKYKRKKLNHDLTRLVKSISDKYKNEPNPLGVALWYIEEQMGDKHYPFKSFNCAVEDKIIAAQCAFLLDQDTDLLARRLIKITLDNPKQSKRALEALTWFEEGGVEVYKLYAGLGKSQFRILEDIAKILNKDEKAIIYPTAVQYALLLPPPAEGWLVELEDKILQSFMKEKGQASSIYNALESADKYTNLEYNFSALEVNCPVTRALSRFVEWEQGVLQGEHLSKKKPEAAAQIPRAEFKNRA